MAQRVAAARFAGIIPGLACRKAWTRVAYQGDGQPGVLNPTTWQKDRAGARCCTPATCIVEELGGNVLFGLRGRYSSRRRKGGLRRGYGGAPTLQAQLACGLRQPQPGAYFVTLAMHRVGALVRGGRLGQVGIKRLW